MCAQRSPQFVGQAQVFGAKRQSIRVRFIGHGSAPTDCTAVPYPRSGQALDLIASTNPGGCMNFRKAARSTAVLCLLGACIATAQERQMYERVMVDQRSESRLMRPLMMGTHYAATSMMPQATL